MGNKYKPEELKEDALFKKMILDTAVDVQSALQILISKGICTKEELDETRDKVRKIPKYKTSFDYVYNIKETADLWEKDPQAYLRHLMEEKLKGK